MTPDTATRVKQLIADFWRQRMLDVPDAHRVFALIGTNLWIRDAHLYFSDVRGDFISCEDPEALTDAAVDEILENWEAIRDTIRDLTTGDQRANEAEAQKWEQRLTKVLELIEANRGHNA